MLPQDEPRISLKAACRHPLLARDGRDLSLASAYRFIGKKGPRGVDGHRKNLEYERGPRGIVTSPQAIARFLAALNGRDGPPAAAVVAKDDQLRRPSSKVLAAAQLDAIGS